MRLTASFFGWLSAWRPVVEFLEFFYFYFLPRTCGAICPSIAFLSRRALAVLNMY